MMGEKNSLGIQKLCHVFPKTVHQNVDICELIMENKIDNDVSI